MSLHLNCVSTLPGETENKNSHHFLQSMVKTATVQNGVKHHSQGSHASWKIMESPGIFSGKFPGPGKS